MNIVDKIEKSSSNTIITSHNIFIKSTKIFASIFIILCVIGGIILAKEFPIKTVLEYYPYVRNEFNIILMLSSWIIGFVSYVLMYGIACIIENTEK